MDMRNGAPGLFKAIPGAQKLGGNAGPGGANWAAIEAVFEYACEEMGLDWGDVPTREQASGLRLIAKERGLTTHVERVRGWFENWYLYYPFVDDVAVRRAVNYDADVWAGLTARERHEVIVRLAAHPDPWADEEYRLEGGSDLGKIDRAHVSGRARRWLAVPYDERKVLLQAVNYHRRQM
jgi:hypothetical protein